MVGGGQLARMTHQAAIGLGQTLRVLAAGPDDPAAQVTPDVVIGSHENLEDLRRAADGATAAAASITSMSPPSCSKSSSPRGAPSRRHRRRWHTPRTSS